MRRNILYLTNRVPFPPDKGDKIRTFHQLDYLAQRHHVYCACFVDCQEDVRHANRLRRWCADLVAVRWRKPAGLIRAAAGWARGWSLTQGAYLDGRMLRQLETWEREVKFDVAVAFSTSMAAYALAVESRRRVLDMCDVDSQKWLDYAGGMIAPASWLFRSEGRRLRRLETGCLDAFDRVLLISERERVLLDPEGTRDRLGIVSNGVTTPAEPPPPADQAGPVVGFVGTMDYRPNVEGVCWFAERVWPAIREAVPGASFRIVGRSPSRAVRRLAGIPGVRVIGAVPSVAKHLAEMRVVVAPLLIARGMQNKVLEAMAMQRPVVATSAVAAGLTDALHGEHLMVADEPGVFADRVIELCRYGGLCQDIGRGGYRLASGRYGWYDRLRAYEAAVLGLPNEGGAATEALPGCTISGEVEASPYGNGTPNAHEIAETT